MSRLKPFAIALVLFVLLSGLVFVGFSSSYPEETISGVGITEVSDATPSNGNVLTYESLTESQQQAFRESLSYRNSEGYQDQVVFNSFDLSSETTYVSLDGMYYQLEPTVESSGSVQSLLVFITSCLLSVPSLILGLLLLETVTVQVVRTANKYLNKIRSTSVQVETVTGVIVSLILLVGVVSSLGIGFHSGMAGAVTITEVSEDSIQQTETVPITSLTDAQESNVRMLFTYETKHVNKEMGQALDNTIIKTDGEYYLLEYGLFADGLGATPIVLIAIVCGVVYSTVIALFAHHVLKQGLNDNNPLLIAQEQ